MNRYDLESNNCNFTNNGFVQDLNSSFDLTDADHIINNNTFSQPVEGQAAQSIEEWLKKGQNSDRIVVNNGDVFSDEDLTNKIGEVDNQNNEFNFVNFTPTPGEELISFYETTDDNDPNENNKKKVKQKIEVADCSPNTEICDGIDNDCDDLVDCDDPDLVDNELPTANCADILVILDENGQGIVTPADIDDESSDNCEITERFIINNLGQVVNELLIDKFVGNTFVTLIVQDCANNSANCTATVKGITNIHVKTYAKDTIPYPPTKPLQSYHLNSSLQET